MVKRFRGNGGSEFRESQVNYTVKYFDSERLGRILYVDFMSFILPCEDPYLRASATQRPPNRTQAGQYLSNDVEKALAALI